MLPRNSVELEQATQDTGLNFKRFFGWPQVLIFCSTRLLLDRMKLICYSLCIPYIESSKCAYCAQNSFWVKSGWPEICYRNLSLQNCSTNQSRLLRTHIANVKIDGPNSALICGQILLALNSFQELLPRLIFHSCVAQISVVELIYNQIAITTLNK